MTKTYNLPTVQSYQTTHSTIWEFPAFWTMLLKNPVTNLQAASEDVEEQAKDDLIAFFEAHGISDLEQPILFSTTSILTIARVS